MTFSNPSNNACIYAKTFSMFSVVDYLGNDACPTCYLKVERIELWHIVGWKVCSIPPTFDGDVLFELPLNNLDGHFGQMQGMDKKYDVMFGARLKWQILKTILTLLSRWHDAWDICNAKMIVVIFFVCNGSFYEITRNGDIVHDFSRYSFVLSLSYYKICKIMMFCVNTCATCMYYIVHKQKNLTQIMIHLGTHDHLVVKGRCKDVDQIKAFVEEELFRTLLPTMLINCIGLSFKHNVQQGWWRANGTFKWRQIARNDGQNHNLCSHNVRNLVASFKHWLGNIGYIYNILSLKAIVVMITFKTYISQDNNLEKKCFSSRCLCMEMLMDVICNLVVNSKQLGSCLNHVKHVKGWKTFACHVYDLIYGKVMMILICDMQYEN
jgi:hypothetical protein